MCQKEVRLNRVMNRGQVYRKFGRNKIKNMKDDIFQSQKINILKNITLSKMLTMY